jgi:membrane associated rhomboid family serine protease
MREAAFVLAPVILSLSVVNLTGREMVFPLYDDNPLRRPRRPYVTWGLIALNVVIFLIQVSISGVASLAMVASFGATPAAVLHAVPQSGSVPPELTLVTGMFLHGGWDHLLGNMIYLWVFGDDIEEALGRARFVIFYFVAGVAASLGYIVFNPRSTTPLIGASGAISGILAAYLMLRPCAAVSIFFLRAVVRVRAYWVIGGWVVMQFYFLLSNTSDGVAYGAHIGGLIAGAGLFLVMRPAGVELFECIEQPGETETG